jgi:Protein of unknown function (DUF1616)
VGTSPSTTSIGSVMTRIFGSAAFTSVPAVLAGVVALTPAPVPVRVLVALPLVLILPGFALASTIFPRSVRWIERLTVSLALSIAVCIVGGLALNWTTGITKASWITFLVATTVTGAFLGQWRSRGRVESTAGVVRQLRAAQVPVRGSLLALCSLTLAVGAFGLARSTLPAQGIEGYTTLWLAPAQTRPDAVQIGVSSSELQTTSYWLELRAAGERLVSQPLMLKTGQEWDATVDVSSVPVSRQSFEALLYRRDAPHTPYRRVTLLSQGVTVPPTTAVWLAPGPPEADTVRVLVTSAELGRTSFRVEVLAAGQLVDISRLTLRPGAREVVEVDISSIPRHRRSFEALLYREGASQPQTPYERATFVDRD